MLLLYYYVRVVQHIFQQNLYLAFVFVYFKHMKICQKGKKLQMLTFLAKVRGVNDSLMLGKQRIRQNGGISVHTRDYTPSRKLVLGQSLFHVSGSITRVVCVLA